MTSPIDTTITDLDVRGTLPPGLCGRLITIRAGAIHSIDLSEGRGPTYRCRLMPADVVDRNIGSANVVAFGGSILACGIGPLAYELGSDLDTRRPVDLAGYARPLSASPQRDPWTGELHLVASAYKGSQWHIVVSAGAFTRRSRPIEPVATRVSGLVLSRDHVVFASSGAVGVRARDGEVLVAWISTEVDAPALIHAHDVGDTVEVLALTPSLERWTLHAASARARREVLDAAPRRSARINDRVVGVAPRFVWSAGSGTATKHDLVAATHIDHRLRPDEPDDLVFVSDGARAAEPDGGWLVGFAHRATGDATDVVVLDAADIARPAIATVRIPRSIPRGLHSTWISATPHTLTTTTNRGQ
jgi:carotenoid cleavage dioxygenase-like enzyme